MKYVLERKSGMDVRVVNKFEDFVFIEQTDVDGTRIDDTILLRREELPALIALLQKAAA